MNTTLVARMILVGCVPIFVALQSTTLLAQDTDANTKTDAEEFAKAGKLFSEGKPDHALQIVAKLYEKEELDPAIKEDVVWAYVSALRTVARNEFQKENWDDVKKHSQTVIDIFEKFNEESDGELLAELEPRYYWSLKTMVVACHGLKEIDQANEYKKRLYDGYREKRLPESLDEFFNMDFFTLHDKNVWGYEYYPNLGDKETEGSFSKFVYFIYSQDDEGNDKDLEFRLHVLKFHKFDDSDAIDYVLTQRWEVEGSEGSKTLVNYTYEEPVEFKKLHKDIREYLDKHLAPKD